MVLIGLLGEKNTGKDTSADYICKKNEVYVKKHFATVLKNATKALFSFSDEQLYDVTLKETVDKRYNTTPRKALQFLGSLMRDHIDTLIPGVQKDFWINAFFINNGSDKNVVIADVRHQNEVDAIKHANGIIIKIVRNTNNNDKHESESDVQFVTGFDYVVENNGTVDELYKKLDFIMNSIACV